MCKCVAVAETHTLEWSGSIFEDGDESCTNIAVHNFDERPGHCKGIMAYGYSAPDGHFVSKVNFAAKSWHNGRTIQCRIDNGPRHSPTDVGSTTVYITQGKFVKQLAAV